jgi:hypothetical protein
MTFINGGACAFHFSLVMLTTADQCIRSCSPSSMVLRFCNETKKSTLLPPADIRYANIARADEAEKIVVSARGKRSTCARQRPHTLTEVETLIDDLVRLGEADGYHELLPDSGIFYCCGSTAKHTAMLNESAPMLASADSAKLSFVQTLESEETAMSVEEGWRRFLGQQLMLLTELMVLVVPAFFTDSSAIFNPSAKRKRMGATRNELNLHAAHFVKSQAKTDAAAVRNIAVSYARKARVCDVVYHSDDNTLFADVAGLQLPAEHDLKTIFMLR